MSKKRKEAFRILEETSGEISSQDLADKVGYSSRSGAWKSKQAWKEQRNTTETSGTEPQDSTDLNNNSEQNDKNRQTQNDNMGDTGTERGDDRRSDDQSGGGFTRDIFEKETDNGNKNEVDNSSERETGGSSNNNSTSRNEQGVSVGETKTKDKPVDTGQTSIDPPEGMPNTDPDSWEPFEESNDESPQDNKDFDDVKSTDELVDEAEDPQERERRKKMLNEMDGKTFQDSQGEVGINVDEDLMAKLFKMPFSSMATVTDYDGWELTDEEAQTNAELFIAYCEENNVEVSTGAMFLMSLSQTVGTRTVGYMRHRKKQNNTNTPDEKTQKAKETLDEEQSEEDLPDVDGGFDQTDPTTW